MHSSGALDDDRLGRLRAFVRPLLWRELESHKARKLGAEYVEGLLGPAARKTVEPMVRATRGGAPARAHERRIYWVAEGAGVDTDLRPTDSLQLLLHTMDHIAGPGAIARVD